MKKSRKIKPFLEELRKVPNVSVVCERVGISRNTFYRWMQKDEDFKKAVDEALELGIDSINDLAESKLVQHINGGSMQAIKYWLDNNKKQYIKPRMPQLRPEMIPAPIEFNLSLMPPRKKADTNDDETLPIKE